LWIYALKIESDIVDAILSMNISSGSCEENVDSDRVDRDSGAELPFDLTSFLSIQPT
jgi:hypothetical protein